MLTVHRAMPSNARREPTIGPAPWIVTSPPGPMTRWMLTHDRRAGRSPDESILPLVVQRGRGSVVEDVDGNRYLDFTASASCCPTGHGQAPILEAIERQVRQFGDPEPGVSQDESAVALAETLARIAPGDVPRRVIMASNVLEAIGGAVQAARDHTGRERVILFGESARHHTLGLLALASSQPRRRRRATGTTSVAEYLPYGDLDAVRAFLADASQRERIAAVLVEPMLVESGDRLPPPEFLPGLQALCREHEILLILDETQTGLGRTGRMFCCEHQDIVPDVVLLSSGEAIGMPVHAAIVSQALLPENRPSPGLPFTGSPLGCAAALAAIRLLQKNMIANADRLASFAADKLNVVVSRHGCLTACHGLGLWWSVDVVKPRRSELSAMQMRDRIVTEAFHRGLLLLPIGERRIRLAPPLCVNRLQLEVGIDVFEEAIETVEV